MSRSELVLVKELAEHVKTIVDAAGDGDPEARRWLATAFPGHDIILKNIWNGSVWPEPRQPCRSESSNDPE